MTTKEASKKIGVLEATHEGVLSLGKIELECHVLEDGKRVFSSRGLLNAFNLPSEQQNSRTNHVFWPLFLPKFALFLYRIRN